MGTSNLVMLGSETKDEVTDKSDEAPRDFTSTCR